MKIELYYNYYYRSWANYSRNAALFLWKDLELQKRLIGMV